MLTFFILASLFNFAFNQTFDNNTCTFIDEAGEKYDLNHIKHDTYWKIKDESGDSGVFVMDYIFNFCKMPSLKVLFVFDLSVKGQKFQLLKHQKYWVN